MALGINFDSFSGHVDIDGKDNHPLVAIMAVPNPLFQYCCRKTSQSRNRASWPPVRRSRTF